MKTKEELLALLEEESHRSRKPKIISSDEYKVLLEITQFKCPANLKQFCGGKRCPPQPEDPHEDYYEECTQANKAQIAIDEIANGKIIVVNGNESWSVPG